MQFEVRDMRPEDIEGKAYVHWKSWQETYPGLIDQNFLDSLTLESCIDKARRWSDHTLVAKSANTVIGFAYYNKYRDDTLANYGEVGAIYVLKEYQHQKIGYALMNTCMEKLREFPQVAVWVLRGNDNAIRFYERYGFRFDGGSMDILLGTPNVELRMIYRREEKLYKEGW